MNVAAWAWSAGWLRGLAQGYRAKVVITVAQIIHAISAHSPVTIFCIVFVFRDLLGL